MVDGKEKTQRRVYVLPSDLVERIVAFQVEKGLASEVEAARRLLDDALRSRDTYKTLIDRFLATYKEVRLLPEVAKDVLAAHPLVVSISFAADHILFKMNTGYEVTIKSDQTWWVQDENDNQVASSSDGGYKRRGGYGGGLPSRPGDLDDEIPF